jgi:hypothetical protein
MLPGGPRRRVCNDVRRMIVEDINNGHTPNEISKRLRVSTTFISELRKTRDAFGTVQPTPWMRLGPALKIVANWPRFGYDTHSRRIRDAVETYVRRYVRHKVMRSVL